VKIAVVGKGGSGKTTTSAVLARTLARRGLRTLALDCDTNPNLGISLGLGEDVTGELVDVRESLAAGQGGHAFSADDLVDRFGVECPDGVRLAVVFAIEHPEPGCPCCGVSPEQMLRELDGRHDAVVADFEAGLHTVMRLDGRLDAVVVLVEPTAKSLDVGGRAAEVVREKGLGRVVVTANRVADEDDLARVRAAFPGDEVWVVPFDPAIVDAERRGVAPLDAAPQSPGLRALSSLVDQLVT
jgi:CO dehydrogenase maturation factor